MKFQITMINMLRALMKKLNIQEMGDVSTEENF